MRWTKIEAFVELQELLYAVRLQRVLIVLQGRDTSGKMVRSAT